MNFSIFNILVIRDYYPSSNNPSSSIWVHNQVKSISLNGFTPLVVSPTPINPLKKVMKKKFSLYDFPENNITNYENIAIIRPAYIKIPNNILISLTLSNLSRCLNKFGSLENIKLIHAHFGQNGIAAIKLKNRLNVPLITSFYGYDSGRLGEKYKPFYKELIKNGDLFLALSNDMKSDLITLGFPEKKIIIHHLGIDLHLFNPCDADKEKFILLTVARLDEVKGIEYVLKGLSLFLEKYPDQKDKIQYRIIGGGVYEKVIKSLIIELKLNENVFLFNNLVNSNSRGIVLDEIKKCDVFTLCSFITTDKAKEGTPIVLMEAQSCGKPCIATHHAGIPEIVVNEKTGILVKEKSPEGIFEALKNLYFNSNLRKYYGINARLYMYEEFNQEIQMKKLYQLYSNITK